MTLMPVNEEALRFEEMHEVVTLYVQNINPTKIASKMGIRRVDVLNHIEEWKKSAVGMDIMKDRVEELIASMDEHYSLLIQKAYEIIEEVDRESELEKSTMTRAQMLSQKLGALKAISDFESKRIDVLQKSGLLEAADMGDELAEMETEMNRWMDIMEEELCSVCKPRVMGRLVKPNDSVVVVVE